MYFRTAGARCPQVDSQSRDYPGCSVAKSVQSRPFSGRSTIVFLSTVALSVEDDVSTKGGSSVTWITRLTAPTFNIRFKDLSEPTVSVTPFTAVLEKLRALASMS